MKKLAIVVCCLLFVGASTRAYGDDSVYFGFATLSGEQEPAGPATFPGPVAPQPGVTSIVTLGNFTIEFARELTHAFFSLRVFNGVGVTQAHIHCGPAGVNGPIVAFLFGFNAAGVNVNGTLNSGVLTNASIQAVDFATHPSCGLTINNMASLQAAILAGRAYVNVHSIAFPAGVTRGQIFSGRQ